MSEQAQAQAEVTSSETATTDGSGDGNAPGQQAVAPKTFTQADLDRIVKERLDQAERKASERAAKAAADAEAKALVEQGKFKELYEKAEAEKAATAKRLAEIEQAQLRAQAARTVGLPEAMADRLRGATLEEMEADAKALLTALPAPAAPNINASAGANAPRAGQVGAAEAAELATIYGVNPKFFGTGV